MLTTQTVNILDATGTAHNANLLLGLTLARFKVIDISWRASSRPILEMRSGIQYVQSLTDDEAWQTFIWQVYGKKTIYIPGNIHWSWTMKQQAIPVFQYNSYAIECNDQIQGAMIVRDGINKKQQGMVYIDYIATAPWNLQKFLKSPPKYKGVGGVLIAAAVTRSRIMGFNGRLSLHSLPEAEGFYRRIGMTEYGKDPNYGDLRYFEMDEIQANKFYPLPQY
jgi:hypothetical protein